MDYRVGLQMLSVVLVGLVRNASAQVWAVDWTGLSSALARCVGMHPDWYDVDWGSSSAVITPQLGLEAHMKPSFCGDQRLPL